MSVPSHFLTPLRAGLVALSLLVVLFIVFRTPQAESTYPELAELSALQAPSFQELSTYFQQLADTKGAPYAYHVLLYATLPPDTDLHLLGHVVGDMLYKQQGMSGIQVCTPDFRNACSHSVVIGVLQNEGPGSLPKIAETCKQAPGGQGAYTMCFHGLGHGVLAYNEYNLEKAVAMCKQTGTPAYANQEYVECVGGTIMEMIAGVHDEAQWKKEVGNYFRDDDPLYPCDASFMPEEVRAMCYNYLTPHLFAAAGVQDLGSPDSARYPQAFSYCDLLPEDETQIRSRCYGGFGKEFVVLAQERDIRDVGAMEEEALRKVRAWCALAPNTSGKDACNASALHSLFWGGENKPDAALTFCALGESVREQANCYGELTTAAGRYLQGTSEGITLCRRFPEAYKADCRAEVF